jgi:hypothetical protein
VKLGREESEEEHSEDEVDAEENAADENEEGADRNAEEEEDAEDEAGEIKTAAFAAATTITSGPDSFPPSRFLFPFVAHHLTC